MSQSTGAVTTKQARQARIRELLGRRPVRSQLELGGLLTEDGVAVTQTTLSRDLEEIGAVKLRGGDGSLVYAVPGEGGDRAPRTGDETVAPARLARLAEELLVSAVHSANLVVLRTPPGGAQLLASAIDHADMESIIGTVAGDDAVLVICRDPSGGSTVAESLLRLANRRT